MNRGCRLIALVILAAIVSKTTAAERPPDIIVLMVDDMGFSDFGCYGSEIRTPNIDTLAAGGLRFSQFYNTGRCCPTRASLMTGLYPHQAGMGWMTRDLGHDGYRGELNNRCVTLAEVLQSAGYRTYMAGKWHLVHDRNKPTNGDKSNWPRQRGFDRFFGTISGAGSFYTPATLTRENTQTREFPEDFFYTDAINDTTARYIREHVEAFPDRPFFCYVAHTAPHWPLHAKPQDIARYADRYRDGWDRLRAERLKRMQRMGLIQNQWTLSPRDRRVPEWNKLSAKRKKRMALKMAIYAAQIDTVDQGIGRIVQTLKNTGRFDNTLFFILADNGGCAEGGNFGFDRKGNQGLGTDESFSSYGRGWANVSNTPFRRYKHWVHEGGIATPLIAHWPAGIPSQRNGSIEKQPSHLIDIMASCVEVSGATYPQQHNGQTIKPMAGRSLRPAFVGEGIQREALYWEHEGNRAVRAGPWKLVAKGKKGAWELYNMEADRSETNNLAAKMPDKVRKLAA
ncbi:MAG: arylsulfatase, partial [Phycisphaeraceae bacterium]|nr:arylsulfatase [Phycisphaeraceae bacterium]